MTGGEDRRRRISDLIGDDPAPKRKGGRPRKDGLPPGSVPPKPKRPVGRPPKDPGAAPRPKKPVVPAPLSVKKPVEVAPPLPDRSDDEAQNLTSKDVSAMLLYGVSVQQLARLFRLTRPGVEKKLRNARPIDLGSHGNPLYDLADAAGYLIEPKIDIEEYLSMIKPERLPDHLRETFWNAKLKRQRYEEKAGDLWRTAKVMEVVGELLLDIGNKLNLIPDRIERMTGLNPEQYRLVRSAVDAVREEVFDEAKRLSRGEHVTNQLGEEDEE